ncbi:abcA7 [Acrasis kona]|uniref:AbcA7 n=1 Tax=Acrasis kona TaxID=1008807 RepID=A0AAW2ZKZ6_9EUKA
MSATPRKVRIITAVAPLPFYTEQQYFDVMLVVGIALFPSAISFLMPIFLQSLVMEKEKKLREMMKMMGMNSTIYWVVNYIFDYTMYTCVCCVFIAVEVIFKVRFFTQTHPLLIFLLFFLWGHAMIAIAFLASTVFSKTSNATLFGYLTAILSMISAEILVTLVYDQDTKAPWWFFVYPYFCFYRGVFLMFVPCLEKKACLQWFETDTWYGGELGKCFLCMALATVVLLILTWYLDKVLPQEFGIRRHPLFFLSFIKKIYKRIVKKNKTKQVQSYDELTKPQSVGEHENKVFGGEYDDQPLVVKQLCKRYGKKTALNGLTLGVNYGECFGLLGPNGAGKTTLLSILYGLFPPSSGTAQVAGYPLSDIHDIHRHIGVSMQFDVLWDSLTVKEHLTFYARLKGVKNVKSHVNELLDGVGLVHKKNVMSKSLSGGMRRRLSLGVALVGSPSVVFLDEPTTGLDPQSRRSVWDCIAKFQKGRAMVLCTHSMDEAAVLCHRLGIMCDGQMQFIGDQFQLRDTFSTEYTNTLDVTFDERQEQNVITYVRSVIPSAQIINQEHTKKGKITFGVLPDVQISQVWRAMQHQDAYQIGGIREWAVGQISLETMFIKLISK